MKKIKFNAAAIYPIVKDKILEKSQAKFAHLEENEPEKIPQIAMYKTGGVHYRNANIGDVVEVCDQWYEAEKDRIVDAPVFVPQFQKHKLPHSFIASNAIDHGHLNEIKSMNKIKLFDLVEDLNLKDKK